MSVLGENEHDIKPYQMYVHQLLYLLISNY